LNSQQAVVTEGYLSADVDGQRFFEAMDLQFLYSPSQPGFWLGGEVDGSFDQRLHFYIPKKYWVVGIHPINFDIDNKAYFNDQLGKTWTTQPGGKLSIVQIDLANERVSIEFQFTTKKDVEGGNCITLTSSGWFKGFTTDPSQDPTAYLGTLRTKENSLS
jgi:hypothetical protein